MPKHVSSLELALNERSPRTPLTQWLYEGLRRAILSRRLPPGTRLPATRDFARQYNVSRGTVVTAFEQLQTEGYLVCQVGAGTWVDECLPGNLLGARKQQVQTWKMPSPVRGLLFSRPARPFRSYEPAIAEFPVEIWARVAGRRLRRSPASLLAIGEVAGYKLLREAVAAYLGSSRGVNCSSEQIVIVSGVQQGLDILTRILVKPGEAVWMEDPGYFGAAAVFRNAGARIIPLPVDEHGLKVPKGTNPRFRAKAAFLTPAHQCPLGMTMPLERRLAILAWARDTGAFIFEDDYDSEYRFEGRPVPALQGLDRDGSVILLGSFNKVLFPSLRMGYVVLPGALIDPFLRLRSGVDMYPSGPDQAILCDFIVEGHFGRHIRRMRELYASRLAALQDSARRYLAGLLDIPPIQAGLHTAALLRNGMTSQQAEAAAAAAGIETVALSRFALRRTDVHGLQLGFAAFEEREIRSATMALARALEGLGPAGTRERMQIKSHPIGWPENVSFASTGRPSASSGSNS
ncbi:MAG TPA: PLP-dependent aminotransferase family protein [Candidatus Acidoferrum sp.]|nr:PLP-dependent aminotransferase family protein [Candidatus Acidoferrum sp.]